MQSDMIYRGPLSDAPAKQGAKSRVLRTCNNSENFLFVPSFPPRSPAQMTHTVDYSYKIPDSDKLGSSGYSYYRGVRPPCLYLLQRPRA